MKELETLKLYRGATSVIELDFTGFNFESNSYCQLTVKKKYNDDIIFQHDFNKSIKYYVTFKDEFTSGLDDDKYKYDIMYMLNEERYPQCSISDIVIDRVVNGYEGEFDTNAVQVTEVLTEGVDITQTIKVTTSNVIIASSNLQEKTVTPTKEEQVILAEDGFDGMSKVVVEKIPEQYVIPNLQDKTVNLKAPINTFIHPDEGYDGINYVNVIASVDAEQVTVTPTKDEQVLTPSEDSYFDSVTVNAIPDEYIVPTGEMEITENGVHDVREKETVNVDIQPNLGTKTITENGVYNASDDGLDGYSSVEVETSGADLTEYFNTNPTEIKQYWASENYILKVPEIVVPSNVTSLELMMSRYTLKNIPKVICGNNVTSMHRMYESAYNDRKTMTAESVDLTGLDTSNVTTMYQMFYYCQSLKNIDVSTFKTSNLKNVQSMFYSCSGLTSLDLSNWDTSKLENMTSFIQQCTNLTNINLKGWDTRNVNNMANAFSFTKIVDLNLSHLNTSNVTTMYQIFRLNSALETLNISGFDFSKVTNISGAFDSCSKLTNLTFGTNLGKGFTQKTTNNTNYTLTLSACTLLTHDSLMNVINNLYDLNLTYDVANGGTLYRQKLVLGATNLAKLTDEEIAIATNKGWTVS